MKNPLNYQNNSDPFVIFDDETNYYYLLVSNPNDDTLSIYRSKKIKNILTSGEKKIVYRCGKDEIYGPMWAPEMIKIDGFWYIYTDCQTVHSDCAFGTFKQIMVLKSKTSDPFDGFEFGSKPDGEKYAIDPTTTIIDGVQYICYSIVTPEGQKLQIREMKDPLTFTDHYGTISEADFDWEKVKPYDICPLNEGPFFVKRGKRLFIVYSANGCFIDEYCLGILEYIGGDICKKESWKKADKPFFYMGNGVYGVGHASFFYSPDKSELWCAYHCLAHSDPDVKEIDRYTCIQKVAFNEDDYPIMNSPIPFETEFDSPKGE